MDLSEIAKWADTKGMHLVATGDWQHPEYFFQIRSSPVETSQGIFKLKGQNPN